MQEKADPAAIRAIRFIRGQSPGVIREGQAGTCWSVAADLMRGQRVRDEICLFSFQCRQAAKLASDSVSAH